MLTLRKVKSMVSAITTGALLMTMTVIPGGQTSVSAALTEDEKACYGPILDMFYEGITTNWDSYEGAWSAYGLDQSVQDISYLWLMRYSNAELSEIGYQLTDLNGDGIRELIVSPIPEDSDYDLEDTIIYDLYTIHDGTAVHLASSGERDRFYLKQDNGILEVASSGAFFSLHECYQVSGNELEPYELLICNMEDAANPYYFSESTEAIRAFEATGLYSFLLHHVGTTAPDVTYTCKVPGLIPFSSASDNTEDVPGTEALALGDVNGDGEIDTADASAILREIVMRGAGARTFTAAQDIAADVDSNGELEVSDASSILMYVAADGAGEKYDGMQDFMDSLNAPPKPAYDVYKDYQEVLTTIYETRSYMDIVFDTLYDEVAENQFAIYDVDNDGEEELVILWRDTYMAARTGVIFGHDADGNITCELLSYSALHFYDNGIVTCNYPHNAGNDGWFWPYTMYRYDASSDVYETECEVGAWDYFTNSSGFPSYADKSKNYIVYYVGDRGPIDAVAFEEWKAETFGDILVLPYKDFTKSNINSVYPHAESTVPEIYGYVDVVRPMYDYGYGMVYADGYEYNLHVNGDFDYYVAEVYQYADYDDYYYSGSRNTDASILYLTSGSSLYCVTVKITPYYNDGTKGKTISCTGYSLY